MVLVHFTVFTSSVDCICTVRMFVVDTLRISFILRSAACIHFILKRGGGRAVFPCIQLEHASCGGGKSGLFSVVYEYHPRKISYFHCILPPLWS